MPEKPLASSVAYDSSFMPVKVITTLATKPSLPGNSSVGVTSSRKKS